MSTTLKYAACGGIAVLAVIGVSWPFLTPASRGGMALAAAIALPVQVIAFAILVRSRGKLNGFLAAWVGGTLARMVVLGVVAVLLIRSGSEGAMAALLSLAGFFFALLLIEPIWFNEETPRTAEA